MGVQVHALGSLFAAIPGRQAVTDATGHEQVTLAMRHEASPEMTKAGVGPPAWVGGEPAAQRAAPEASGPLLRTVGISKAFGHTQALAGAEFELRAGEVHALCGANGAGKSTLSRVIAGQIRADEGTLIYRGSTVRFESTRDAIGHGISMVMQETSLCPDLSVLENIYLPELGMRGRLSRARLRQQAEAVLQGLDPTHHVRLGDVVGDLAVGTRQLIEIAKAIALDSKIIIFDEPTASFSPQEVENLFDAIRLLARQNKGLVFVSHRLEEIFDIADRVTVLRDGRTVAHSVPVNSLSPGDLIRLMVGRELTDIYAHETMPRTREGSGKPYALEVRHLSAAPRVRDVSFGVRAGEILGLAGLVGAGRSETAEAIFGLRRPDGGEVLLDGKTVRFKTPTSAVSAGIGFIGEDRRGQGIAPDLSVEENLMLAHLGQYRGAGRGYRRHTRQVTSLLDELGLPDSRILRSNMLNLSGGQQQKIILARWLLMRPKVLILDEPTRGVDIGTRSSIYEILRKIAAQGIAVVVISSDFEEVLGISDRVVVLSDGAAVTDIPSAYLDVEKLTMFAAPRTSAEATHRVLTRLTASLGGVAYWIGLDEGRVYCFDSVTADGALDIGLASGRFPRVEETRIAKALTGRGDDFTADQDGQLVSLLTPIKSHRGQDLGYVGLTLNAERAIPSGQQVRDLVREAMEQDAAAVE